MSDASLLTPARSTGESLGTGRRKTAVARVRIKSGSGNIKINGRPLDEFFHSEQQRQSVLAPLTRTNSRDRIDITITVDGGGLTGQADACKLGIARALKSFDTDLEPTLREFNLLTRDSRMKERKHYGLRGARRGTQFSKR